MLGLPPARELQYLGQTGCLVSPGWDDAQELADCLAAADHLGISRDSRDRLWRIVASLLLLGELQFGPADAAEASIGDAAVLQKLCSLIEVDHEAMGRALTIKMTKMGADWIKRPTRPRARGAAPRLRALHLQHLLRLARLTDQQVAQAARRRRRRRRQLDRRRCRRRRLGRGRRRRRPAAIHRHPRHFRIRVVRRQLARAALHQLL